MAYKYTPSTDPWLEAISSPLPLESYYQQAPDPSFYNNLKSGFVSGVLGTVGGIGGFAKMAGLESVGDALVGLEERYDKSLAPTGYTYQGKTPGEVLQDVLTPGSKFWATGEGYRQLGQLGGSVASFAIPQAGAAKLVSVAGRGASTLGKAGQVISAFADTAGGKVASQAIGSLLPTAIESASEGGSTYNEMLKRGFSAEEAARAGWDVTGANIATIGTSNAAEMALAFAPTGGKVMAALGKVGIGTKSVIAGKGLAGAGLEGYQEVMQQRFQDTAEAGGSALGSSWNPVPQNAEEAISAIMGGAMGGAIGVGGGVLAKLSSREVPQQSTANTVSAAPATGVNPTMVDQTAMQGSAPQQNTVNNIQQDVQQQAVNNLQTSFNNLMINVANDKVDASSMSANDAGLILSAPEMPPAQRSQVMQEMVQKYPQFSQAMQEEQPAQQQKAPDNLLAKIIVDNYKQGNLDRANSIEEAANIIYNKVKVSTNFKGIQPQEVLNTMNAVVQSLPEQQRAEILNRVKQKPVQQPVQPAPVQPTQQVPVRQAVQPQPVPQAAPVQQPALQTPPAFQRPQSQPTAQPRVYESQAEGETVTISHSGNGVYRQSRGDGYTDNKVLNMAGDWVDQSEVTSAKNNKDPQKQAYIGTAESREAMAFIMHSAENTAIPGEIAEKIDLLSLKVVSGKIKNLTQAKDAVAKILSASGASSQATQAKTQQASTQRPSAPKTTKKTAAELIKASQAKSKGKAKAKEEEISADELEAIQRLADALGTGATSKQQPEGKTKPAFVESKPKAKVKSAPKPQVKSPEQQAKEKVVREHPASRYFSFRDIPVMKSQQKYTESYVDDIVEDVAYEEGLTPTELEYDKRTAAAYGREVYHKQEEAPQSKMTRAEHDAIMRDPGYSKEYKEEIHRIYTKQQDVYDPENKTRYVGEVASSIKGYTAKGVPVLYSKRKMWSKNGKPKMKNVPTHFIVPIDNNWVVYRANGNYALTVDGKKSINEAMTEARNKLTAAKGAEKGKAGKLLQNLKDKKPGSVEAFYSYWTPIVRGIALRFVSDRSNAQLVNDAQSYGLVGLELAIDRYMSGNDKTFNAQALITRQIVDNIGVVENRLFTTPRQMQNASRTYYAAEEHMLKTLGRTPTSAEIKAEYVRRRAPEVNKNNKTDREKARGMKYIEGEYNRVLEYVGQRLTSENPDVPGTTMKGSTKGEVQSQTVQPATTKAPEFVQYIARLIGKNPEQFTKEEFAVLEHKYGLRYEKGKFVVDDSMFFEVLDELDKTSSLSEAARKRELDGAMQILAEDMTGLTTEEVEAAEKSLFEKIVKMPGFEKVSQNYRTMTETPVSKEQPKGPEIKSRKVSGQEARMLIEDAVRGEKPIAGMYNLLDVAVENNYIKVAKSIKGRIADERRASKGAESRDGSQLGEREPKQGPESGLDRPDGVESSNGGRRRNDDEILGTGAEREGRVNRAFADTLSRLPDEIGDYLRTVSDVTIEPATGKDLEVMGDFAPVQYKYDTSTGKSQILYNEKLLSAQEGQTEVKGYEGLNTELLSQMSLHDMIVHELVHDAQRRGISTPVFNRAYSKVVENGKKISDFIKRLSSVPNVSPQVIERLNEIVKDMTTLSKDPLLAADVSYALANRTTDKAEQMVKDINTIASKALRENGKAIKNQQYPALALFHYLVHENMSDANYKEFSKPSNFEATSEVLAYHTMYDPDLGLFEFMDQENLFEKNIGAFISVNMPFIRGIDNLVKNSPKLSGIFRKTEENVTITPRLEHQGLMGTMDKLFSSVRKVAEKHPIIKPVFVMAEGAHETIVKLRKKAQRRLDKARRDLTATGEYEKLAELSYTLDGLGREAISIVKDKNGRFIAIDMDDFSAKFQNKGSAEELLNSDMLNGYEHKIIVKQNYDSGPMWHVVAWNGNDKVFGSVGAAAKYRDNNVDNVMRAHGYSDNVIQAYRKRRVLMSQIRDKANVVRRLTGRSEIGFIEAYTPHYFGEYIIKVDRGEGFQSELSYESLTDAVINANLMAKENPDIKINIVPKTNISSTGNREARARLAIEDPLSVKELEDFENSLGLDKEAFTELFIGYQEAPSTIEKILSTVPHKSITFAELNELLSKGAVYKGEKLVPTYREIEASNLRNRFGSATGDIPISTITSYLKSGGAANRATVGFMKKRSGAKGWIEDFTKVDDRYFNAMTRYIGLQPFKQKSHAYYRRVATEANNGKLTTMEHKAPTQELEYLQQYINDINGNMTAIEETLQGAIKNVPILDKYLTNAFGDRPVMQMANNLTGITTVLKLGLFNVSSSVLQLTGIININARLDGSSKGAAKYFSLGKWTREGLTRAANQSSEDKKLIERAGLELDAGLRDSSGFNVVGKAPELKDFGKLLKEGTALDKVKRLANLSLIPFTYLDRYVKGAALLGAYHQAMAGQAFRNAIDKNGKQIRVPVPVDKDSAFRFAKEIMNETQFETGLVDTPGLFRKFGPIGSIILQFKKYPIKQLELAFSSLQGAEKATFWVSIFLIAGMAGFPGLDTINALAELMLGKDYKTQIHKAAYEWAGKDSTKQWMVKQSLYGIASNIPVAGTDIANRVGLSDIFPRDIKSLLGPTVSTGANVWDVMIKQPANADTTTFLAKAISPAIGNFMQAYQGESRSMSDRDRLLIKYDPAERALKALGFTPIRETIEREQAFIVHSEEQRRQKEQKALIDGYLARKVPYEELAKAGIKKEQIDDARKKLNAPRVERAKADLSKERKNVYNELLSFN